MLETQVRTFSELNKTELYDLLQLRSEVFVVEQDCVYQDIDGKDQHALHVLGYKENRLVAYTRVFRPGDYFNSASIGRVVVAREQRYLNYGQDIMKVSIKVIKQRFNEHTIKISAQCYLKNFYSKLGFRAVGEEYLEDDIPHIVMILD